MQYWCYKAVKSKSPLPVLPQWNLNSSNRRFSSAISPVREAREWAVWKGRFGLSLFRLLWESHPGPLSQMSDQASNREDGQKQHQHHPQDCALKEWTPFSFSRKITVDVFPPGKILTVGCKLVKITNCSSCWGTSMVTWGREFHCWLFQESSPINTLMFQTTCWSHSVSHEVCRGSSTLLRGHRLLLCSATSEVR